MLVTLGFDALGIGLVVPIVPRLVQQLSGRPPSGASFAVGALVATFGNLANPAVRALISQAAGPQRQGRVMGALSSVEGLTAIVSPIVAATLFSHFTGPGAWARLPGLPFLVAAAVYLAAILAIRRGVALSPKLAPSPP